MSDKLLNDLKALLEEASKHPGFYSVTYHEPIVSDVELKIREEVMEALNEIMSYDWFNMDSTLVRAKLIKDRLNLLWGE
jgi:hypothetical protein